MLRPTLRTHLLRLPPHVRTYSTRRTPLKVAVIGSGPSGFYTASRILHLLPPSTVDGAQATVDMYERLPTPYGLARYGVAPDHPEVKNVQHKFDDLTTDPRFTFFGNVSVGERDGDGDANASPAAHLPHYHYPHALHVPLADLLPHYSAIIFAYGSSRSNPLSSVPGSSASPHPVPGVYPALAFVNWYNGHPAHAGLTPDLSRIETVDIVGQGNVALDVARILLADIDFLRPFDLPEHVLQVLSESRVRRVRAVGRRGPAQVAFSTKEFREMVNLPGITYPGVDGELMAEAQAVTKGNRARTRLLALMDKPVSAPAGSKEFSLDFLKAPRAFLAGGDGHVNRVEWDVTKLEYDADGNATAHKTGAVATSHADMVVESVGYRAEPLGGVLPFNAKRGVIRNAAGRVTDADGAALPGLYAAGWAARGPVGVIATTMQDAFGLVDAVLDDYASGAIVDTTSTGPLKPHPEPGRPEKIERGLKDGTVVDIAKWQKIDNAERELGKKTGRQEREKFRTVDEMLAVL